MLAACQLPTDAAAQYPMPAQAVWMRCVLVLVLLAPLVAARAAAPEWVTRDGEGEARVHLWFFWSQACPHCLDARPVVQRLADSHPWLALHSHEVTANPANTRLYVEMARALGQEARAVPAFILCGEMMTGFAGAQTTGDLLEQSARACRAEAQAARGSSGATAALRLPEVAPVVAGLELSDLSLPAVTLLLAAMDAFNPCAFFVLLFLLSLLTHEHARSRMLIVGGVFVLFSGLVYFGLMAAWLNVFLFAGELRLVTLAAGLLALTMAALNLKDYVWFRRGPSLSIPDSARPRLFERMRRLLRANSLSGLLLGTVVLALAANSYELLCTAGLPMVYTRLLTLQDLSTAAYYAYLVLYNLVYVMPLLIIVLLYVRTLGSRKLSEGEGRVLKLMSGLMMLGLGAALVFAPHYLARPAVAGLLVLVALLAGLIAWRHERGLSAGGPG
jgi:hypothetical protein